MRSAVRHGLLAMPWVAALMIGVGTSSAEPPAPLAVLTARLFGLRSEGGQVGCLLFSHAQGFPKDPSAAAQGRWCPIVKTEALCAFDPMPAGTYALACFHDENKNRKLDTGLFGIPTEGTVASNYARGVMGPPSFEAAKFAFRTTARLDLKMGY